jgi:endonuclease YncB( thermonuclease family)
MTIRVRRFLSLIIAIGFAALGIVVARPPGRMIEGPARVVDGDTLWIGRSKIRLRGIDAPERQQSCTVDRRSYACGHAATEALRQRLDEKSISCRVSGRDRYERLLARCRLDGDDIGAWLVRVGLAVSYGDYEREETTARKRKLGLWAGSFERPSAWRQRNAPSGS